MSEPKDLCNNRLADSLVRAGFEQGVGGRSESHVVGRRLSRDFSTSSKGRFIVGGAASLDHRRRRAEDEHFKSLMDGCDGSLSSSLDACD